MAFIDYGTKFDIDSGKSMDIPEYGKESYIQSEETNFDLAKKRHNEIKKDDIDNENKDESENKKEESESKESLNTNIGVKPKHYVSSRAIEEYKLRHPDYEHSEESELPKIIAGSISKTIIASVAMPIIIAIGSLVIDKSKTAITNSALLRKIGPIIEKYLKQCIDDMIHFSQSLQIIKDSNIINELKEIDENGRYSISSNIDNAIKKYSLSNIDTKTKEKLEKHFKKIFVSLYKAYKDGEGFGTDNVALDYSELIISGTATSQSDAQKVLNKIESLCKSCGSTFNSRSNYFNSDHSFATYLVMTPTLDVKQMCTDIDRQVNNL